MLIKVDSSLYLGLSDVSVSYINTDYIVSVRNFTDDTVKIDMVNGSNFLIKLESFEKIIKLKSMTEKDIQQMLLEDSKTMLKEKQNEEKVIYKIPVGDIPEDVKRDKLEKLKKEMKEIRNNSDWEIIDE